MSHKISTPSKATQHLFSKSKLDIVDSVIVGDGIVAKYTAANVMHRMQKQAIKQPKFSRKNFEMLMIGVGDGRAYTANRGHSGVEKVNLMRNEMSHRPGNIVPLDENFMTNNTLELEYRCIHNQRPYDLRKNFTREGIDVNYSLEKKRDTSFTLQEFVEKYYPEKANDIETERHILSAYSNYVVNEELAQTKNLKFGKVEGSVSKIDYDQKEKFFTLQFHTPQGEEPHIIRARHVVLATGLEADTVPPYLKDLIGKPGIYSGEGVFNHFMKELDQAVPGQIDDEQFYQRLGALKSGKPLVNAGGLPPEQLAWQNKKGLVIGSGLTMSDAISKLITKGCSNFDVVSRHALTHELPMDAPVLKELEGVALEIGDLFNVLNFQSGKPEEQAKKIKAALIQAKDLAQSHELEQDEIVQVRGQPLSRANVGKALLAQFAVFSYEKLRGELRTGNTGFSDPIAAQLLKNIDKDKNLASWITTSRTSTTVRNIKLHEALRDTNKLRAAEIEKIEEIEGRYRVSFSRPENTTLDRADYFRIDPDTVEKTEMHGTKFHVTYKKPESVTVDYLVNCAGRPYGVQKPGSPGEQNSSLTNYLFENGLHTPHAVGDGVAMDTSGRSQPDREKFGLEPIELYVATPFSSKGDQYMPANQKRHPLSNTVAESVLGLRPLIKQVSKALVYNLAKWSPDQFHVEYVYGEHGAVRESELDYYEPTEEEIAAQDLRRSSDESDAESDTEDSYSPLRGR
ncbi:MAG: hypothetical protein V4754_16560 [Pseudomonadota bacterium]